MIMPWHQGCLRVPSKCVYACMYVCMYVYILYIYIYVCVCVCVCLCVCFVYTPQNQVSNNQTEIHPNTHALKSGHRNVGHALAKWFVLLRNTATSTKSLQHCLDA